MHGSNNSITPKNARANECEWQGIRSFMAGNLLWREREFILAILFARFECNLAIERSRGFQNVVAKSGIPFD
jgi:hypothetical protein